MKKYTLSATGDVRMYSNGSLELDGADLLAELAKSINSNKEEYGVTRFAGKIEITITDITEPLAIEEEEC